MQDCQHKIRQIVKRIYVNGSIHYVRQCLACGHVTNAIPHEKALEELNGQIAPAYDADLRDEWYRSKRNEYKY